MEPKVLLLSESFCAGDAITGLNLFSKWNKQNLYIASRKTICFYKNFNSGYLIGNSEIKFRFPFKYFNKVPKSKIVECNKEIMSQPKHAGILVSNLYLGHVVPFLKLTGLFAYRATYRVSEQFLKWIDYISPDCIYTSVGSLNMAEFVDDLMTKRPHLKYIIHGYDDWVDPNYFTISSAYTKRSLALLNSIMSRATLTFATSEKMAEDYAIRYSRKFDVFPNPVEKIYVSSESDTNRDGITFVGKILNHNLKSILLLASALNHSDSNLTFHIYSDINDNLKKKIISKYSKTVIHGWVKHDDIPEILRKSKILYLPISIDKQTVKFTKYSMSTKMSEYLSSGVPILFHGPSGIAMTELIDKNKCGFVVKDNKESGLVTVVNLILTDKDNTRSIVNNAFNLFFEKFEKDKVAADFKMAIVKMCL